MPVFANIHICVHMQKPVKRCGEYISKFSILKEEKNREVNG